ncbi:ATP-binding protein [Streptomyces katsurahamanus]|uniref:ATP-binding protein n=2 Tax=Streptomyces katsurahamanus TaxID=2577098 RepID=A0ABW9NPD2_9ACTN|nr:ATP-binding protein [Streptomyces katsurahamanus]
MGWNSSTRCVGLARDELRKSLENWGLSEIEDSALVVLSELFTNAVIHAWAPDEWEIETRFVRLPYGLRIEVLDGESALPRLAETGLDGPGGRGIPLVAALAERWGTRPLERPGKAVWD